MIGDMAEVCDCYQFQQFRHVIELMLERTLDMSALHHGDDDPRASRVPHANLARERWTTNFPGRRISHTFSYSDIVFISDGNNDVV
jgi:hypothetical protein